MRRPARRRRRENELDASRVASTRRRSSSKRHYDPLDGPELPRQAKRFPSNGEGRTATPPVQLRTNQRLARGLKTVCHGTVRVAGRREAAAFRHAIMFADRSRLERRRRVQPATRTVVGDCSARACSARVRRRTSELRATPSRGPDDSESDPEPPGAAQSHSTGGR